MARPRPLVLCGPSGSGKSTLLKRLMEEYSDCFGFSVSHTTRKPRTGEINGREYHFVDRYTMEAAIANGEFIESAEYSGNLYGTSKKSVKDVLDANKICVLDIDVQGVKAIRATELKPKCVFIKPPSLGVLEQRLRDRGTESQGSLQKRLAVAQKEMEFASEPGNFDVVIVNDNLAVAYQQLKDFIKEDVELLKKDSSEF